MMTLIAIATCFLTDLVRQKMDCMSPYPSSTLFIMARDKGLEELVHDELLSIPGITDKAMFGGWVWLLNGNLLCGARDDGMLVRLGKWRDAWALQIEGIESMISRGRVMQGWVLCGPDVYGEDALRKKLMCHAIEFVRSLS